MSLKQKLASLGKRSKQVVTGVGVAGAGLLASAQSFAITSVVPASLATDQAVIEGDITTIIGMLVALALVVLGGYKVLKLLP